MEIITITLLSLILVAASFVIISKSPVNAVCFLIAVFFLSAILFIMLNVDFIGFIFLMVYVGAVAVLFLFVIMMLYLKKIEVDQSSYITLGLFILCILFSQFILFIVYHNSDMFYIPQSLNLSQNTYEFETANLLDEANRFLVVKRLGILIFNENFPLLVLIAFNLLVSMFGAVLLTNRKQGYNKYKQQQQEARSSTIYYSDLY